MPVTRLKKRADYLRVAAARNITRTQTAIVQCCLTRNEDKPTDVRVGFTASKRVGNAVYRNRAKRRLRAWVDQYLQTKISTLIEGNIDFVFIALTSTAEADFLKLSADLEFGVERCLRHIISAKSKAASN